MKLTRRQTENFWRKVNKKGPGECWPWIGGTDRRGYGLISFNHKTYRAPRVAILLSTGEMPCPEHDACHSCDTPACVNPSHLTGCTRSQNMLDAVQRGRVRSQKQRLEPEQVLTIRNDPRPNKDIATDYGLDNSTISKIKHRVTWRYLS